MSVLEQSLKTLKGVGDKRAALFEKLDIHDISSLLKHYPRDYQDRSRVKTIDQVENGETACISAMIADEVKVAHVRRGMDIAKVRAVDGRWFLDITFFNQSYVKNSLKPGKTYVFYGRVEKNFTSAKMINPQFVSEEKNNWGIEPIYRLTEGLNTRIFRDTVKQALELAQGCFEEVLPEETVSKNGLCSLEFALKNIHFPESWQALEKARNRLVFEELFIFSCGLALLKGRRVQDRTTPISADASPLLGSLPYSLTDAQRRAVDDILSDLGSGLVMNRLVQGDVGSGKTVVAAAAAYVTAKSRRQTALMAPTDILAKQHYAFFSQLLEPFGIRTVLLTGSMPAREKRSALELIALGMADIIIGTHALISQGVEYKDLALVITDEQHRFGVAQRSALAQKGTSPHLLVMSATPIPRTMALIIYGDLDISVIDQLPPGRQKVDTFVVGEHKRQDMYGFIRRQVQQGRQIFIVCPAVEKSETLDVKSAEDFALELKEQQFPDLRVAMLHGKMKASEKDAIMGAFVRHEYDILVSTTVIEVGVDVPNANTMIIENGERFGLSQLHQLRGRVGRGQHKSYCFIMADGASETSMERLKVICKSNDGFYISQQDLALRGPGDFFGRRQHGLPQMHIANLQADITLLTRAQEEAKATIVQGIDNFLPLKNAIRRLFSEEEGAFN